MNWADVRVLYLRELRSALRERSIVINSIIIPIVLYPLIIWIAYTGFSFVSGQLEVMASRVMLVEAPPAMAEFRKELESDKSIEWKQSRNPDEDIRSGHLDLLIEFLASDREDPSPATYRVKLTYDQSRDQSAVARQRVMETLARYRGKYLEKEAHDLGISPVEFQAFWVESKDVSTSVQMGQFILGLVLPIMLIVMLAIGAVHPAIDSTAGERENSTWETTLAIATDRSNVIIAKYLYVATMSVTAGLLNLLAMMISIRSLLAPILGEDAHGLSFRIPLRSVPVIAISAALLALFVAAGMMILASFARTFKEGQSMVGPFYIAMIIPIAFLQSPRAELTPSLAVIPIVNVTMVYREAIAGIYHWPLIGLTLMSEFVCIAAALWLATSILKYEDFVIGSYGGNLGKFVKERMMKKS
jgi:sodium transport system permease protein